MSRDLRGTKNLHGVFNVWEWLLGTVSIGVLAVIILPNFLYSILGCKNQAIGVEAEQNIGAMNRAQQAYLIEFQHFADSFPQLHMGIETQTENYNYSIRRVNSNLVFDYATPRRDYVSRGPLDYRVVKGYVGAVALAKQHDAKLTITIVCVTNSPSTNQPPDPVFQNGELTCAEGTREISLH